MKKRAAYLVGSVGVLAALGICALVLRHSAADRFATAVAVNRPPRIHPGYSDTVIPPNIAPLNFVIDEPGTAYGVRVRSARGEAIDVVGPSPRIAIPLVPWRQLLESNRGGKLHFDVYVRRADGRWTRFDPIANMIADADIDNYLFYRFMRPIYILRVNMAIHQRDLRTFEESVVLSNRSFEGGCINCHAFAPNHPERMLLHVRGAGEGSHWSGMVVVRDGKVSKVDTRALAAGSESGRGRIKESMAAYTTWHPNGRVAAFSANDISQFFHAVGENRDVFDAESDLALYDADSNTVSTSPSISSPDHLETFPAWSPDGRYLYFCSTLPLPKMHFDQVRYDLMRIPYDPDSGDWGKVEPILLAKDTGMSITEPRVSPDGRWVLFCMSAYGSFPAYQPSSDLYLFNLETRRFHKLRANSPRCESWHCWSANSRWIAFASKRRDGLFSRIYFSYIDESGHAHKPLVLPQKDPSAYDRMLRTYNVPELSRSPAPMSGRPLARAVRSAALAGGAGPESAPGMQASDVP